MAEAITGFADPLQVIQKRRDDLMAAVKNLGNTVEENKRWVAQQERQLVAQQSAVVTLDQVIKDLTGEESDTDAAPARTGSDSGVDEPGRGDGSHGDAEDQPGVPGETSDDG